MPAHDTAVTCPDCGSEFEFLVMGMVEEEE